MKLAASRKRYTPFGLSTFSHVGTRQDYSHRQPRSKLSPEPDHPGTWVSDLHLLSYVVYEPFGLQHFVEQVLGTPVAEKATWLPQFSLSFKLQMLGIAFQVERDKNTPQLRLYKDKGSI